MSREIIAGFTTFLTMSYIVVVNPVALGIVFWAGVIFLLISATPLRERVAMAIPGSRS